MRVFDPFFALHLLLLLSCTGLCQAQDAMYEARGYPERIPSEYRIDPQRLYDSIMAVPDIGPPEAEEEQVKRFAEQQSYGLEALFHGGSVYMEWDEMEGYLGSLLDRIIPDDRKLKGRLEAYPSPVPSRNARAFYDGTILVNVGIIADAYSEAELAMMLGHEAAHFFEKDVEERFFLKVDPKKRRKRGKESYQMEKALEEAAYSREQERVADSIGARFAHHGNYDLDHGIQAFYKLKTYKELYEVSDSAQSTSQADTSSSPSAEDEEAEEALQHLFSSHPSLKERMEALRRAKERMGNEGKVFAVRSEDRFERIRRKARYETLHLLLRKGSFEACAMRAFRYHLLKPDDPVIRGYLVRSLRRLLYVEPGLEDEGFLHWVYAGSSESDSSILNNLHYLIRDSLSYNSIRAERFLDEEQEFRSYEEAFHFFSKEAMEEDRAYAYLSRALDKHREEEMDHRDSLLQLYVQNSNARYPDFAKSLRDGELYSREEEGHSLMVVDRLNFLEDHRYGLRRRFIKEDQQSDAYIQGLDELIEREFSEEVEVLYGPDLQKRDLEKSIRFQRSFDLLLQNLEELVGEGSIEVISDGERIESGSSEEEDDVEDPPERGLFILSPTYYRFFKKNGISSMEYLHTLGYDDRVRRLRSFLDAINPWFYLTSIWRFDAAYKVGASRYYHQVQLLRFAPWEEDKLYYAQEGASFDLTKNNFLNAAYYAIGGSRWSDEE